MISAKLNRAASFPSAASWSAKIKNANQLFSHPAQADNRLHKLMKTWGQEKPHTKIGLWNFFRKFCGRRGSNVHYKSAFNKTHIVEALETIFTGDYKAIKFLPFIKIAVDNFIETTTSVVSWHLVQPKRWSTGRASGKLKNNDNADEEILAPLSKRHH